LKRPISLKGGVLFLKKVTEKEANKGSGRKGAAPAPLGGNQEAATKTSPRRKKGNFPAQKKRGPKKKRYEFIGEKKNTGRKNMYEAQGKKSRKCREKKKNFSHT